MDWPREIAIAQVVQQEIAEIDHEGLWSYHLPEVAATEADIAWTEQHLGLALESKYRQFLRHANGWKCFHQDNDLFGTEQLVRGGGYDQKR